MGTQKRKVTLFVQNLNNITSKRYEIGCQLVLITNRESHGLSIGTEIGDLE